MPLFLVLVFDVSGDDFLVVGLILGSDFGVLVCGGDVRGPLVKKDVSLVCLR